MSKFRYSLTKYDKTKYIQLSLPISLSLYDLV